MSHVNTIPWTPTDALHTSVQMQPGTSLMAASLCPHLHQATGCFQEVQGGPRGSAAVPSNLEDNFFVFFCTVLVETKPISFTNSNQRGRIQS